MSFISEKRAEFETFLVEIPMLLDDLQEVLKKSKNYNLVAVSFEDDTIKAIEKFYCSVLNREDDLHKSHISFERLERIILAYIGEAVIERTGRGRWSLNETEGTDLWLSGDY